MFLCSNNLFCCVDGMRKGQSNAYRPVATSADNSKKTQSPPGTEPPLTKAETRYRKFCALLDAPNVDLGNFLISTKTILQLSRISA
jgi:hypothetical protein